MEFIFLYLANLSIGGITLLLNTAYKAKEIEYFLKDSGSSFFITCKANYLALKHITDTIKNLKILLVDGGLAGVCSYPEEKNKITGFKTPKYPARNNDVATICYTSGTTGEPKGAMITHRNLVDNVRALTQAWQWGGAGYSASCFAHISCSRSACRFVGWPLRGEHHHHAPGFRSQGCLADD